MKGWMTTAAAVLVAMGGAAVCSAAVPLVMNYQGKMTDADGKLVADGSYEMVFSLYDAASGGAQEWAETWDSGTSQVQVTKGLFNVLLGSHNPLTVDFGHNYWLEQQVKYGGSYETLLPRQQVASVGYAMRAEKVTDGAITDTSISASAVISDTKLATIATAGKVSGSAVSGGTLGAANGSALTNLSASNIGSGTLGATYLPSDGYASTYVNTGGDTMTGSLALPANGLEVGTSQLVVSGGNVGIGTTDPQKKMHISNTTNPSILITDTTHGEAVTDGLLLQQADNSTYILNQENGPVYIGGNGVVQIAAIGSTGNVGVGTTAPEAPLHVFYDSAGTFTANTGTIVALESASKTFFEFINPATGIARILFSRPGGPAYGQVIYNHNTDQMEFNTTNVQRVVIDNSGKVGIGRQPTTNILEVEGNASKTAAGDWLANSDRRIKTDIADISDAVGTLRLLRPVKFKYTDEYKAQHPSIGDKYYYNFIAQEFQQVFPNEVTVTNDEVSGCDHILAIDPYIVTPYLVKAVQEMKSENEALVRRIQALEAKLDAGQ